MAFAHENGWSVEEGRISFPKVDELGAGGSGSGGDVVGAQKETIQNMVGYARDLEMIV